ncbi:UDP-4-amino-4,6-dideoxy-N-acetyl-beta-L-altrosamine transaminase [Selenomonas noxia]|uniref:UDP-4-keto-6-deoxy-N-acetylglucosamine 4-aminotransferase n=1 Tax=Selenomonas noxia F0398 TaxID=702437 RepID=A0ABN0DNU9_9FIRM|nr:UDP-4-amino-4,6-dideoxy-N-acetyl-beta-L-altrosamine transaminase [Selenomonas noxia]EHG23927.1 UDP-4-keto-6-deoxy-N-acetylglucosamine 4-aminotransferase [Selenomonas noxia F0398]
MIYYGRQDINQDDIEAVRAVLTSDFLTQGPAIERLEKTVASYCGAKYAVAVCNATAALHIACRAAGLKQGDVLWTAPNTFVASANCGLYCGSDVDFVDIDAQTYNMSTQELEKKFASSAKKPKVLVPVHFSGQPCDMEQIHHLAKEHDIAIVEDASHAIGAEYKGERIGSCKYSDMTVFSFHPVKIITTGEGGMVLTNNPDLYEKLRLYRSHGITRDPNLMSCNDGSWYYEQIDLGYNYRVTDMQAALGTSQMKRLPEFLQRRRYLAKRYNELLADLPLTLPYQMEGTNSSWHLYVACFREDASLTKKERLFQEMKKHGITLNMHYIPVHLQPYYQNMGFVHGDFPVSEAYYEKAFTLPLYYGLSDAEQETVVEALHASLSRI